MELKEEKGLGKGVLLEWKVNERTKEGRNEQIRKCKSESHRQGEVTEEQSISHRL